MSILVKDNIFVIETKNTHYVFGVDKDGYNRHIHWGKKASINDYEMVCQGACNSNHSQLDGYKQELTVFGKTIYRDCSVKACFSDNCHEIELEYIGYNIDGSKLVLTFKDTYYPLEIDLNYQVYDDFDIIKKYITVRNTGNDKIVFERLFSAEVNLPGFEPYTFRNTNGAWGSEFVESKSTLEGGYQVWESRRGSSNHCNTPSFIASVDANEVSGDVFFGSLAYSGNFKISASRDLFMNTRVHIGMNDFDFSHTLKAGEIFSTPELYFGLANGFGDMSRQMNTFAVEHILPKQFNNKELPVLYNSWEATEFNVSVEGQTKLARLASMVGVELFVMDDGWFGMRNNDKAGLGDWYVNKEKFPNGLEELIKNVNELGMDFGLWLEPEMVNPDSDLFRNHPDWAYHYDTRTACELRNQLVLNLTKPEVKAFVLETIDELLTNYNIKYIKWDMNRPFSQVGAENLEDRGMYSYLHTKSVYDIVDALKKKHTDVQIEACASGGGRAELGALSHFDMVWTSDNTDSVDRLTIQGGYSLLRPTKAMRCWVTDVNWYNKPMSLDFRFNVAMQGALSLGGNLLKYSQEDLEICKKNIDIYKEIRGIVQFGDLYRIMNFDAYEISVNQYVSKNKSDSVVFIAAPATRFFKKPIAIRLQGLDENKMYSFEINDKRYEKSGLYLMNVGITMTIMGVSYNKIIRVKEI